MSNLYSDLHNLYDVSKTLRFELQPIGKTKENFENYILANDEEKAEKFKKVKTYCDEVHKVFINNCLANFNSTDFKPLLQKYYELFITNNRSESEDKEFEKIQENLRKKISECFKKNELYKGLFEKDMVKKYLPELYKDDEEKLKEIQIFADFTTYFTGYYKNRQNMYSEEEKSTAISFRLINQNLPTYIKNIQNFKKIKESIPTIGETLSPKLGIDVVHLFSDINVFVECLTQNGIDNYNYAIGGKTTDNGEKLQGINEFINLYNQQNPDKKLPKLKVLYKQILSDRTSASFKIDKIEDDKELVELINSYYETLKSIIDATTENSTETELVSAIKNLSNYDTNKIWINQDNLTNISQQVFGNWNYLSQLIEEEYNTKNPRNTKQSIEKYNDKRDKDLKRIKEYSLAHFEELTTKDNPDNIGKIFKYFSNTLLNNIEAIKSSYAKCSKLLSENYETGSKTLLSKEAEISELRDFVENMKSLQTLIKTLMPKSTSIETDDLFYNALNYETLSEVIPVYNKARNYVTQKPYSIEKFPLTFNCPTLLDGWDLNKEENNLSTLFEKDGFYYLGIMNKKDNRVFRDIQEAKENEASYKKIEYKLLPGPNKMLPKVFFSSSRIDEFNPTEELLNKYKKGCHKKGTEFDINFCRDLIDFYKKSLAIHQDWSQFNFKFDDTNSYQDISKFYRQVEEQGYKISMMNISESYIDNLVEEGKLFLFRIYNKDFSEHSKGTPNLHTLYWKALFDEDNLKDVIYKLNGGAEIFYRKKSIEYKVTHPKNQPIKNKNELNHKKESTFSYDLIKNKRFTMDKFLFHVPITLNFKSKNLEYINEFVNTKIKDTDDINVIGIDRGERNLIYLTVVNSKGELLEQISLNEIVNEYKGETYKTDYHSLLNKKEEERNKARKSWGTIENIKELKEGYMSQVIHKITDLMIKYNAIIVLEDLNSGFKNSRKKVEKQVYDKFETMLINKLSYFVDKKQDKLKDGGILKAYQFVNKKSKGKQSGILFYIPAWNTSKIDPVTGFVNLFKIKNMSIEKTKEFFNNFENIKYNQEENLFEFDFDYSKFADKAYGIRKNWTIYTYGERIKTFRNPDKNNTWDNEEIKLTEKFKELFEKYSVDLNDIKTSIQNQTEKKFFDSLIGLFKLTLQMRNSVTNTNIDYILSPVKDKNGNFYDSRKDISTLPKDADANGAYNIARKGLMLIAQIKEAEDLSKLKLAPITNAEWLTYVQEKNI